MKVLLIQPPFTIYKSESRKCHPPLGLAYIAGALKDSYDVTILDSIAEGYENIDKINRDCLQYGLSFEEIKKRIASNLPDIVGVSCLFSAQADNVYKVCRIVKEIDNNIITIIGGAHPSVMPHEILKNTDIDFVIMGEGEIAVKRLLESIEIKNDIRNIDGVAFRDNGYVVINNKRRYETNLDMLAFPYWDIFPLEKYFRINNPHGSHTKRPPFIPMITSRGCPFQCIFCSIHNIWGRDYRTRSAENVLSELDYLIGRFGIKEILFEDDNLTLDRKRAKQIFQMIIDRGLDILWSTPNGVAAQTLDDEMLELMKRSGCYSISVGVESGDEYVLKKIIKKPTELSKVESVIMKAKSIKLKTSVFFVVGLPQEGRAQINNTFRFAKTLDADNVNFFFATPLPGTELLNICKEKHLISIDDISFRNLKSDRPSFATDYFSISELEKIVNRERTLLYVNYMLRNPIRFFKKVAIKLVSEPQYFIRFIRNLIVTTDSNDTNIKSSNKTKKIYSLLWKQRECQRPLMRYHINLMQDIITENIVRGSIGIDVGSGCGYDTFIMAANNPYTKIISMDISDGVYSTLKITNKLKNVSVIKGSVDYIPLKNEICDFAYSFGVLHHTIDPVRGLTEIARITKKKSPIFLYLYEDHSDTKIKYIFLKIITFIRRVTTKISPKILYCICAICSPFIFILFSIPSKILKRFKRTSNVAETMPFNFGKNLFGLTGDLYDRFGAPIEHRFNKNKLYELFERCGFYNINITKLKTTAGWVIWGYKC